MDSSYPKQSTRESFPVRRVCQLFSELKTSNFANRSDKVDAKNLFPLKDEQESSFSIMSKEYDIEALPYKKSYPNETDSNVSIKDGGAVPAEAFVIGDSWYAKAQRVAGKFGVEQRGIERVPSDERLDAGMSQVGTMVCSQSKLDLVENKSLI